MRHHSPLADAATLQCIHGFVPIAIGVFNRSVKK
jgi:hypothetical protein